jgi:uncharacterized membrane protein YhdT
MEQHDNPLINNAAWSSFEKIAFRFCVLFFGLHMIPFPLTEMPVIGEFFYEWTEKIWSFIVNIGGKVFFNIPEITVKPNGSGDTTWNWVQEFLILFISSIGCLVWSLLSKNCTGYTSFAYWFETACRYYLGLIMLSYGFAKVFPSQFGTITSYRLHQQLGDMSPMGLLWTFMAYSKNYQFFSGLAEVVGGSLLLFRKTQLIGSLVSFGVMLNIFALNMCYDVPVKLFSFNLMLLSLYIASFDLKRIINFFFLNKTTEARTLFYPFSDKKWYKYVRLSVKTLLIGYTFYTYLSQGFQENTDINAPLSSFYGPYTITKFVKNGVVPTESDTTRWEKMFIDRRGSANMIFVSNDMNHRQRINFKLNDTTKILTLSMFQDTVKYPLAYTQPDTNSLIINGIFQKDSVYVELKKLPKRDFLLVKRGFNWVNELPFNK